MNDPRGSSQPFTTYNKKQGTGNNLIRHSYIGLSMPDQEKSDYSYDVTSTKDSCMTSTHKFFFVDLTFCLDRRIKHTDRLKLPGFLIQDYEFSNEVWFSGSKGS